MIEQFEVLALSSIALKNPEYFQRKVCRYYSEHFHTPLLEVYNIPWPFVFSNYLEHVVESNHGQEGIFNLAVDICHPDYRENEEQEIQDVIKRIERQEEERRAKELAKLNPPIEEEEVIDENPDIEMKSTSFEHLEDEMEEGDE